MNIGEFKMNNGRLIGSIATRTIDLPKLGLRPVESNNDKAPAYEVLAMNVGNRWVQVGALWEAVSNSSGEVFLQGNIDDPCMNEPLPIALFGNDAEGYRVAWRRQPKRDDFGPVSRNPRGSDGPTESGSGYGGFGGSTADDNGQFAGDPAAAELDDEIQF